MDAFDLIGPIMVGPSSSHTAGAVRIANIARSLARHKILHANIFFHGSFAQTYHGHGTDLAIIGGLLGLRPDDERMIHAFDLANDNGLTFCIRTIHIQGAHPNTVALELSTTEHLMELEGVSIGGGNVKVVRIDGCTVDFSGRFHTLVIPHKDRPGQVARVTRILTEQGLNIAGMSVHRSYKGGDAMMIIETDDAPEAFVIERLENDEGVRSVAVSTPVYEFE